MKIIGYLFIALICILAFFGFLILIEYLKYYKRKIVLKLNSKLYNGVPKND